jgi:hypothetical protein
LAEVAGVPTSQIDLGVATSVTTTTAAIVITTATLPAPSTAAPTTAVPVITIAPLTIASPVTTAATVATAVPVITTAATVTTAVPVITTAVPVITVAPVTTASIGGATTVWHPPSLATVVTTTDATPYNRLLTNLVSLSIPYNVSISKSQIAKVIAAFKGKTKAQIQSAIQQKISAKMGSSYGSLISVVQAGALHTSTAVTTTTTVGTTAVPLTVGIHLVNKTNTTASMIACQQYAVTTGCDWTQQFNCPGQTGGSGKAKVDGSHGYFCCCTKGFWKHATTATTTSPSEAALDSLLGGGEPSAETTAQPLATVSTTSQTLSTLPPLGMPTSTSKKKEVFQIDLQKTDGSTEHINALSPATPPPAPTSETDETDPAEDLQGGLHMSVPDDFDSDPEAQQAVKESIAEQFGVPVDQVDLSITHERRLDASTDLLASADKDAEEDGADDADKGAKFLEPQGRRLNSNVHVGFSVHMPSKSKALSAMAQFQNKSSSETLASIQAKMAAHNKTGYNLMIHSRTALAEKVAATSTTLSATANAGERVLPVVSTSGFNIGARVKIGPGTAVEEVGTVVGYGSIVLQNQLKHTHGPGTTVQLDTGS